MSLFLSPSDQVQVEVQGKDRTQLFIVPGWYEPAKGLDWTMVLTVPVQLAKFNS